MRQQHLTLRLIANIMSRKFFILLFFCCSKQVHSQEDNVLFVLVAFDHSPPYSSMVDGKATGRLVELMALLLEKQGLALQPVFCPWARCISLIKNGEVDMIPGISYSDSRNEFIHFVAPPFFTSSSPFGFYILSTAIDIEKEQDLAGLTIGKIRGNIYYSEFEQSSAFERVDAPDAKTLFNMLLLKRIDTFIYLEETAGQMLNRYALSKEIKASSYVHTQDLSGYLGIARQSRFLNLKTRIGAHLTELKSTGKLSDILNK